MGMFTLTQCVCVIGEYEFPPFCRKKNKKYVKQAIQSLKWFDRVGIQESFNWVTWTDGAVSDLQDGINKAKKEREYCTTDVRQINIEQTNNVCQCCLFPEFSAANKSNTS